MLKKNIIWFSFQPAMMFFHIMVTYWSRSERDCSCTKPRACINSWAATPDHMQPGVCSDRVWLPPVCPRNDQQLVVWNRNNVSSSECQVKAEPKINDQKHWGALTRIEAGCPRNWPRECVEQIWYMSQSQCPSSHFQWWFCPCHLQLWTKRF